MLHGEGGEVRESGVSGSRGLWESGSNKKPRSRFGLRAPSFRCLTPEALGPNLPNNNNDARRVDGEHDLWVRHLGGPHKHRFGSGLPSSSAYKQLYCGQPPMSTRGGWGRMAVGVGDGTGLNAVRRLPVYTTKDGLLRDDAGEKPRRHEDTKDEPQGGQSHFRRTKIGDCPHCSDDR